MNKERLVIQNFGPIKSVDLELGKMTILIGEQATGKSTIAKVLSVCRYFSFITDSTNNLTFIENIYFDNIFREYGIHEYINETSYFQYDCEHYELKVEIVSDGNELLNLDKNVKQPFLKFQPNIIREKSEKFKKLMKDFSIIKPKVSFQDIRSQSISTNWNIPTTFLLNEVKDVMDNPFYFPTERGLQSIFSLGKDSLHNLSSLLYNQFVKLYDITNNFINELYIKPLGIYYKSKSNIGYIKKKEDINFLTLSNGASGFQSAIPVFLAIKYYTEFEKRKRTFIIEEPELNLFPKTQKNLMELFVENINSNGHSFLLPTHSPYILSSLTNLIYAHQIANIDNGKFKARVNQIIPEKYWIDVDNVAVYYLENGEARSLVNKKEALLNIDDLDSVSKVINDEFDALLSIEVEHENNL